MNRRRYLALAAAAAAGLTGCTSRSGPNGSPTQRSEQTESPLSTTAPNVTPVPLARHGFPSTICEADHVDVGIDAITEPAFAPDWSAVTHELTSETGDLPDDEAVVGLAHEGRARAYPIDVLWTHEIVNDDFGAPVIVTYCPICFSGMVAERVVGGTPTLFGVSGQLWQPPEIQSRVAEADDRVFGVNQSDPDRGVAVKNSGNLVMYDVKTGSYWSQMLGRAICGEHTGEYLTAVPSTTTTWGSWRADHPDTEVLLPPPHSKAGNPPVDGDQD